MKVASLNPDSKGVTCLVKIVSDVKESEGGAKSSKKFYEATCGDDSGKVVLSLTEEQKGISQDQVIVVRNASVKMVKGHIRLVVDKWGKLDTNTNEKVEKVGDKNVSETEYELVA